MAATIEPNRTGQRAREGVPKVDVMCTGSHAFDVSAGRARPRRLPKSRIAMRSAAAMRLVVRANFRVGRRR